MPNSIEELIVWEAVYQTAAEVANDGLEKSPSHETRMIAAQNVHHFLCMRDAFKIMKEEAIEVYEEKTGQKYNYLELGDDLGDEPAEQSGVQSGSDPA